MDRDRMGNAVGVMFEGVMQKFKNIDNPLYRLNQRKQKISQR
jgi:hypothetical protein